VLEDGHFTRKFLKYTDHEKNLVFFQ
jgi:hypothetical protein